MNAPESPTILRRFSLKALLVVAFWGFSFVATRVALEVLTPTALVAVRFSLGAVTMLGLGWLTGRALMPAPEHRWRILMLGGILAFHISLQAFGLQWTSATNTAWIIAFTPAVIAAGARIFLREAVSRRAWLGILIGMAGVLLVSGSAGAGLTQAKLGDLLALVSCVTWAAYTLLAVELVASSGPLAVTTGSVSVAALITIMTALTCPWIVRTPTLPVIAAVVFLGIICSGAAYWLWCSAVRDVGSTSAGSYLYLEPLITTIAAAALIGERVAALGILGGLLVLLAVRLASPGSTATAKRDA